MAARSSHLFGRSILAFWLQSQRELAVHGTDSVPIEADVGSGGVRIAPRLLQRLFEKDSLSAGGDEQRVDRLYQQARAEGVTEPVVQAHVEWRLLAALSRRVGLRDIAEHH